MNNRIIEQGVKNLKEFGYPGVNADNILTDMIYSEFFRSMLKDNLGHSAKVDIDINEILAALP